MDDNWKFKWSLRWLSQFTRGKLNLVIHIILRKVDEHHKKNDQLKHHVDHRRHVTVSRFRAKLLLKFHDALECLKRLLSRRNLLNKGLKFFEQIFTLCPCSKNMPLHEISENVVDDNCRNCQKKPHKCRVECLLNTTR